MRMYALMFTCIYGPGPRAAPPPTPVTRLPRPPPCGRHGGVVGVLRARLQEVATVQEEALQMNLPHERQSHLTYRIPIGNMLRMTKIVMDREFCH